MATVTFSSTFSKVDGLDSQIVSFIRKLQQHPEDPGLNLKKPKGAKDKNVRTARINKQYRAVLFDLSGSNGRHFVLVDILDHDDAYKKAERLRLETNPINGVAVLREEAAAEPEVEASLAKAQAAEEQAHVVGEGVILQPLPVENGGEDGDDDGVLPSEKAHHQGVQKEEKDDDRESVPHPVFCCEDSLVDFLVHGSSVSPAFASFKNSDISLVTHLSLW